MPTLPTTPERELRVKVRHLVNDLFQDADPSAEFGVEDANLICEAHTNKFMALLTNQATELLGEVEKLKEKNDGQCPSCNNPSILGMHHTNTNEHYAFYNKALDDVKKLLISLTSE